MHVEQERTRAGDTDADAAHEVGEADEQAGEKEAVAGVETRVGLSEVKREYIKNDKKVATRRG